jgi:hypothetical protein
LKSVASHDILKHDFFLVSHPYSYRAFEHLRYHPSTTLADYEWGYLVDYRGGGMQYARKILYTNAIHVKFRALHDLPDSKDWNIKYVHLEYVPNSGRYGKRVTKENIVPNPVRNSSLGWDSSSLQGPNVDAGLQLMVHSQPTDNLVSTAQIQSRRE